MLERAPAIVRRAGLAVGGAAAVAAAQVAIAMGSLAVFSQAGSGTLSYRLTWLPLMVFSFALVISAVALRRRAPTVGWVGPLLVATAPFTAFGGGCLTLTSAGSGVTLRLSGVRIVVGTGGCATYLNGAVLVVGAGLVGVALWSAVEEA